MGERSPLLFLSYPGSASAAALALADRIESHPRARDAGLRVWIDKRRLVAGRAWMDQIEHAIEQQTTAFCLYLPKATVQDWVRYEVRSALDRVVSDGRRGVHYPFVPLLGAADIEVEKLPTFVRQYQGLVLGDDRSIDALLSAVLDAATLPARPLVDEPFRGLEAFGADDAGLFFGRKQETRELVERLLHRNFVLVMGDSGAGKSSLVRAGLAPAFREGAFADPLGARPESSRWRVVEMRPRRDPFLELRRGFHSHSLSEAERARRIDEVLASQDERSIESALLYFAPDGAGTLLVVDQFEELWTQCEESARKAFLAALLAAVRPGDLRIRVVGTIRRDYSNLCSDYPDLAARIEEDDRAGRYLLRRMSDDGLRAVVERPLILAGTPDAAAKALSDAVLRDVTDQAGDLALVEMALTETWRQRAAFGGDLLRAFAQIGRVEGALATAAEDVFTNAGRDRDKLSPEEQPIAEALFMRLARLADAGITRRPVHRGELSPAGWAVAQKLAGAPCRRLLVVRSVADAVDDSATTDDFAEISHERIVTQWKRYHGWLRRTDADPTRSDDKRRLDRLMDEAEQWEREGRKEEDLASGTDLTAFGALLDRRRSWLSPCEVLLVESSRAKASAEAEARRHDAARNVASRLWFDVDFSGRGLTAPERDALLTLGRSHLDVRAAFLDILLSREAIAQRFCRAGALVMRALVGLDRKALMHVGERAAVAPTDGWGPARARACAACLAHVDGTAASKALTGIAGTKNGLALITAIARDELALSADVAFLDALADSLLAAVSRASRAQIAELAGALVALAPRLDDARVRAFAEGADLSSSNSVEMMASEIGVPLARLIPRLEHPERYVLPLVEALEETINPHDLEAVQNALVTVASRCHAQALEELSGRLVAHALSAGTDADPDQIVAIGVVLGAFLARCDAQRGALIAGQFVEFCYEQNTADRWIAMAPVLSRLAHDREIEVIDHALAALSRDDTDEALSLAIALTSFDRDLSAEISELLLEKVVQVSPDAEGLFVPVDRMNAAISTLIRSARDGALRALVPRLVDALQRTTAVAWLEILKTTLLAILPRLEAEFGRGVAESVLGAIAGSDDPDQHQASASILEFILARLDERARGEVMDIATGASEANGRWSTISACVPFMDALRANELARRVLVPLLESRPATDLDDGVLRVAGQLAPRVDAEVAAVLVQELLALNDENPLPTEELTSVLTAFAPSLRQPLSDAVRNVLATVDSALHFDDERALAAARDRLEAIGAVDGPPTFFKKARGGGPWKPTNDHRSDSVRDLAAQLANDGDFVELHLQLMAIPWVDDAQSLDALRLRFPDCPRVGRWDLLDWLRARFPAHYDSATAREPLPGG